MATESKVKEINLVVGLWTEGFNEIQRYFKRKPKVICGHPTPPLLLLVLVLLPRLLLLLLG